MHKASQLQAVILASFYLTLLVVCAHPASSFAQPASVSFVASAPRIVTSRDELLAAKINLADAGIYALNDHGVLRWFAVGGPLDRKGNYRAQEGF